MMGPGSGTFAALHLSDHSIMGLTSLLSTATVSMVAQLSILARLPLSLSAVLYHKGGT